MNNLLTSIGHIWQLGLKELRSLWRDRLLLLFVIWAFSGALYTAAKAAPDRLHRAAIAVVDEDQSPLSQRIVTAFYPPTFMKPTAIGLQDMDAGMDAGRFTFVMDIPPDFQSDVLAGKQPSIQLNVDATQMSQAFLGAGYIQSIALGEVAEFLAGDRIVSTPVVDLAMRNRFNPGLDNTWFMGVMELINNVTMLSIVLTGAALIREREHGTIEHLLVLPLKPSEIMLAKVWAMGAVVLLATALALGEPVWPGNWWPLIALMLASQIMGQGLLVYSLGHFPPLVIGLALLTQPAVAAISGYLVFGEVLMPLDIFGMALLGSAFILARKSPTPSDALRNARVV